MLFFCCLKQNLVRILPIKAIGGAVEDDELMVENALNIYNGNWLGNYKYNTLVKNAFFPIFLALCKVCSVSYINAVTILYSIACIIFMFAIRKNIKNNVFFLLMFLLLLFNPIMHSAEVFQRVYRNSIIPALSLIVVGSYIAIFLNRNNKIRIILFWSIIASITFACFYYTREDSIWLVPFIIFIIMCSVISLIINFVKDKKLEKTNYQKIIIPILKLVLLVLPIITTSIFGNYIATKNEKYYGVKIINTQSKSNFSKLLKTINSIKPNEDILYVINTREKLERMAKVSPSFAKIKPELDKTMANFQYPNGEVINGLFLWPFIQAVSSSGYDTLPKEDSLFIKMNDELTEALDSGKLERQQLIPILGGEILKSEDYLRLGNSIKKAIKIIFDYKYVYVVNSSPTSYYQGLYWYIQMFKEITGNRIIFDSTAVDSDGNKMIELNDQDEYIKLVNEKINILQNINEIYTPIAKVIQSLGIICYIILTIIILVNLFNKKYNYIENWIVESSIIGAIFTLILGICYSDIITIGVVSIFYLCGAYPLSIAFSCISIYNIMVIILNVIKNKKNFKNIKLLENK